MKKFSYSIDGNKYVVVVNSVEAGKADIEINGKAVTVNIEQDETPIVHHLPKRPVVNSNSAGHAAVSAPKTASKGAIISPLPGTITKIMVATGQDVKKGDVLLTMEAMKMENSIQADRDGKIKSVLVQEGKTIMQGEALVEIE